MPGTVLRDLASVSTFFTFPTELATMDRSRQSVEFYFDVVCPWAYIASKRIEKLAQESDADLEWHPTLLGGIYDAIRASWGKQGSASDVNAPQKRKYESRELYRTAKRLVASEGTWDMGRDVLAPGLTLS